MNYNKLCLGLISIETQEIMNVLFGYHYIYGDVRDCIVNFMLYYFSFIF